MSILVNKNTKVIVQGLQVKKQLFTLSNAWLMVQI